MHHDIEEEPVSFFLREVCRKKLSGHLFVNAKDFQITLNFLDGKLANGMSTRFDEKLSVILHMMGRIDEEQYDFLSGLHQFSDDQVAGILLDQNFAKKKDIYYARIYQLRRIAISTFALERGMWNFTAGEPDPPLRETFEIPLEGILVEGRVRSTTSPCMPACGSTASRCCSARSPSRSRFILPTPSVILCGGAAPGPSRLPGAHRPAEHGPARLLAHHAGVPPPGHHRVRKGGVVADISVEIAALLELNQKLQTAPAGDPGVLGLPAAAPVADVARAREDSWPASPRNASARPPLRRSRGSPAMSAGGRPVPSRKPRAAMAESAGRARRRKRGAAAGGPAGRGIRACRPSSPSRHPPDRGRPRARWNGSSIPTWRPRKSRQGKLRGGRAQKEKWQEEPPQKSVLRPTRRRRSPRCPLLRRCA